MYNNLDKLGKIIKEARLHNGLTREQLSEKLCISPRYLMSIENENKKPSFDLLFRMIRELVIPADSIFFPENQQSNTETEELVRLIYKCDDRSIKIATATVKAMLEN
ncbi:MAG TPA: helix-turn-helix transcriptional regulator [Paludibacter sp.]